MIPGFLFAAALAAHLHASAVTGAGLGSSPTHPPNINLVCGPGDSIENGFGLPSTSDSWCNQACALVAASAPGAACTANNIAITGSTSWEWVPWTPPAIVPGQTNIALISIGSNDLTIEDIYNGNWETPVTYPANGTGHQFADLNGPAGATVTTGNPTVFTFSYTLSGRTTSDWIECHGANLGSFNFVPFQPSAIGSNTITGAFATSGGTAATNCVLSSDSTTENWAIFRATTGGTTGAHPPPWELTGTITDGTVGWTYISPSNVQATLLADLQTNVTYFADTANAAGYHVVLGTIVPRPSGYPPIDRAAFYSMQTAQNAWLVGRIGSHGVRSVVRFDQTARFGTDEFACSTTPADWQSDCVHPSLAGATYMAGIGETAILAAQ